MIAPEPVATCPGCSRQAPVEDMVQVGDRLLCEPCQVEGAKAEQRRDSLDAAWTAVEAVLPKGWLITGLSLDLMRDETPATAETPWYVSVEPRTDTGWTEDEGKWAKGKTPIAALRALAVKLAEVP